MLTDICKKNNLTQKQKMSMMRSKLTNIMFNKDIFVHLILNNILTLRNIVSVKECNWKNCKKKNIKLMKCKRCKSVYYCSKICQKKDWILSNKSHKSVCKVSKKRDYSITICN